MQKKSYFLLLSLMAIILTGCSTYRLVEVDVNTNLNTKPEITTVPFIDTRIAQSRNIVISYSSDYYENNKNTKAKDTTILMASKGMWVTEIEREFVKKGFRVLSRQKYNELIREKGVQSSKEVANLLGADLIIQINSLEYAKDIDISERTQKTFKIFVSNSRGKKIAKGRNSEINKKALAKARQLALNDIDNNAYMALLDCKIIDAKTGELIIFYRNQILRLASGRKASGVISYIFKLDDENWKLISTEGISFDPLANKIKKGINRSQETNIKIQMVRRVCSDLVNKISDYRRKGKNK